MTRRKPEVYLKDILVRIKLIEQFIEGVSESEFYDNIEKQDAVLRRLEIIGEAVKTKSHRDGTWFSFRTRGSGRRCQPEVGNENLLARILNNN